MTQIVLMLPDGRALGFDSPAALGAALARGAALCGSPAPAPGGGKDEPWLDATQLAEALHVPRNKIEVLTREGVIPHVRVGRRIRYRRGAAEAALMARETSEKAKI